MYRYFITVVDEWGTDLPLGVVRVDLDGVEEKIQPGVVWKPEPYALEWAHRTQGYSAVEVDAATAEQAAAKWVYEYQRIVDRSSGRPVAYVRFWRRPSLPHVKHEQSTWRSGVWLYDRRLWRIENGLDDCDVETVEAATVEEYLRDLPRPEYRYFAVVNDGRADFSLAHPADVLRVRADEENGAYERLDADWKPYDLIAGAGGRRELALLEIDEQAVAEFRPQQPAPPEYTYYVFVHAGGTVEDAQTVVRQRRDRNGVHEEEIRGGPRWVVMNYAGRENRDSDPDSIEVSLEAVERIAALYRYTYHEILPPGSDEPMAVVRRHEARGGWEEAAVGWPVWYGSKWLAQIAAGKVAYRAREVDEAAVERFLRRAAADRPEFRYFAFLDTDDSIDAPWTVARMHCREDGEPWLEEVRQRDGSWARTSIWLEINHGKGSWWLDPVEVPRWLFERLDDERLR